MTNCLTFTIYQHLKNKDSNLLCIQQAYHAYQIKRNEMNRNLYEDYHKRYKHAITSQDDQRLWKMIDWSGNANVLPPKNHPSVQELSEHFIQLYEPIDQEESLDTLHTNVNIPLLDEPITPEEVYKRIT